jgi:hypothetical protein
VNERKTKTEVFTSIQILSFRNGASPLRNLLPAGGVSAANQAAPPFVIFERWESPRAGVFERARLQAVPYRAPRNGLGLSAVGHSRIGSGSAGLQIFSVNAGKIFIPQWLRAIDRQHSVQNIANKELTCKILWNKELAAVFCFGPSDVFFGSKLAKY